MIYPLIAVKHKSPKRCKPRCATGEAWPNIMLSCQVKVLDLFVVTMLVMMTVMVKMHFSGWEAL